MLFLISLEAKFPQWGKRKNSFVCVFLFLVICCSICPQNTSLISVNETTAANSMRLNPHIQYYSSVYVISMGVALILKTMRGLVFVKVSFLRDPCHTLQSTSSLMNFKGSGGVWKEFQESRLIVLIVICPCSRGSTAVIENSSGPNPFICPLPCSALQQPCWCVCVCHKRHT